MGTLICSICQRARFIRAVIHSSARRRTTGKVSVIYWFRSSARMATSAVNGEESGPTIVNISPVLRLHRFKEDVNTPLVLLMPWATATERALDRFRTIYAQQGFNVVTAYATHPKFYVWPPTASPVVAEILKYLLTKTDSSPIVVHAFSIGAYIYSMLLARVIEHSKEFNELQPRIRGQVFDSIVIGTLKEQRVGLSQLLAKSWLVRQLIFQTTSLYFLLTHSYTVAHYEKVLDIFWNNPFKTSILCIYSSMDQMCKTEAMEKLISVWKARTGHEAHYKKFDGSHHAECLRNFPEEYQDCLVKYLNTLKMRNGTVSISKL